MPNITLETFSGTHYEIGVQQGKAVGELIRKGLEHVPTIEAIRLMKPRLLPTALFLALAKRRAAKLLKNDIFNLYPRQAQRLRGMAEGARINIPTALFLQSMELLIGKPSFRIPACTSIGFNARRTSTKEPVVAKNFDYLTDLAPYQLVCQTSPTERYKTLGCTMAPLAGMADGMNEQGLTVTYNLAYTTETPQCFAPLSLALQEMLETCRNTDEAVKYITQTKQGGHDALLMIADAEDNIKTVEITPNHSAIRETIDGQIINTNHYHTAEMQQYEIPHNAVYSGNIPKEFLGVKVHESSEQRLKRARELLKGQARISERKIIKILRDHGDESKPSMLTICRHHIYTSTLRSVILYPNRKTIKVLYGNPCQNDKYDEFTFS